MADVGNRRYESLLPGHAEAPLSRRRISVRIWLLAGLAVCGGLLYAATHQSHLIPLTTAFCASSAGVYASPFSSVLTISLARRTDRRQHMRELDAIAHLGLEFFDAIDKTSNAVKTIVETTTTPAGENGKVEAGAVAARLSHLAVLEEAERRADGITLILEDDIDIEFDFNHLAVNALKALPADWGMLFFGFSYSEKTRTGWGTEARHPHIYKAVSPQGAFCYAVSPRARKILLAALAPDRYHRPAELASSFTTSDPSQPIDEAYANLVSRGHISAFTVWPNYARQAVGQMFGSDIGGFAPDEPDLPGLMDSTMAHFPPAKVPAPLLL